MDKVKLKDILVWLPKSSLKAGDGLENGKFPFFTSSQQISKFYNEVIYDDDCLIFGTGGNPSIHYYKGTFATSTDCFVTKLKSEQNEINVKYVFYFLKANINILERGFKGVAIRHLSKTYLKNIEIDIPSLEEQNRIVSLLDKFEGLNFKIAKLNNQFTALIRSNYFSFFGDPILNPNEWELETLGNLGIWKSGGTPSRTENDFFKGNIPWVTSGELNELFISETLENISQNALKHSNAKIIEEDSLLVGMYDTAALKLSINTKNMTCNQAIAYSKLDSKKVNTIFVYCTLLIGREYYKRNQRGARQQNLNLSIIKDISIPVPPLSLQKKFSDIVVKHHSISTKIKSYSLLVENLHNVIAQLAFKEELSFSTASELESLLQNDFEYFKKHIREDIIELLLERLDKSILNKNKFNDIQTYDKAKNFVLQLLKDKKIVQVFDKSKKNLKLVLK